MSQDLPPLAWLRAFEAAARANSFTAAARELNMTQPAVSYQIRALERRLGARLFRRHARRVDLTELGRAYLPAVRRAFAALSASTAGLFGLGDEREVTVRCAASFAALWLAPRLRRFVEAHPNVGVRLYSAKWPDSPQDQVADVDVRYGDGAWPGQEVALLRRERCVPVCSPESARRLGDPPRPAAAADAALMHIMGYENFWRDWFQVAGLSDAPSGRGLKVDSTLAALEIAASGHGLAIVFERFADRHLQDGRLVAPFRQRLETPMGHYVLLPEAAGAPKPEAVLFRDWLLAEAAEPE
jgi:LysR family glycine cleavage system transcriptional activator